MPFHKDAGDGQIHRIYDQTYADDAARDADTTWNGDSTNIGKLVLVTSDNTPFMLVSTTPSWFEFGGTTTSVDTIYSADADVAGDRLVNSPSSRQLELRALDLLSTTYTKAADITLHEDSVDIEARVGDGAGGITSISRLLIDNTQMQILDQTNSTGFVYAADYSSNFTDRSLLDKAAARALTLAELNQTLTGSRTVTANNDLEFAVRAYDLTSSDYLAQSYLQVSDEALKLWWIDGNGAGGQDGSRAVSVQSDGIKITDGLTTTGDALNIQATALTTGSMARLYSNVSSTNVRDLLAIINDNAAATGARGLYIRNDSTGVVAEFEGTGGVTWNDNLLETKADDIVEVRTADDFGTLTAGQYALTSGKVYVLKNDITLSSGGLLVPTGGNVSIRGDSRLGHTITYTYAGGSFITGTNVGNVELKNFDLNFNSGTQEVFGTLDGDNVTSALFLEGFRVIGIACAGVGTIQDMRGVTATTTAFAGSIDDRMLLDNTGCIFSSCSVTFTPTTGNPLVEIKSTDAQNIEFLNSRLVPASGESAFLINSTVQNAGTRMLFQDLVTGTTGDLFDSAGLDETDARVYAVLNFGRKDSFNIGSMIASGNATATTISTTQTWTDINLNATGALGSNAELWTLNSSTTGEITYGGNEDFYGSAKVNVSCISAGSTQEFRFRLVKNGSPLTDAVVSSQDVTSSVNNVSLIAPVTATNGDDFRVQVYNQDGTSNITIQDISMEIS